MKQVVVDTNVLISAILTPQGNANYIMQLISHNELQLIYSEDILAEYKRVLSYEKLGLSLETQSKTIEGVNKRGKLIKPEISTINFIHEDDRIFYDAAKESSATLITGNIKHYPTDSAIMTPANFLLMLKTNI